MILIQSLFLPNKTMQWAAAHRQAEGFIHSSFLPAFPLARSAGATAQEGIEIRFSTTSDSFQLAPHTKTGLSQTEIVKLVLGRPLGRFPVGATKVHANFSRAFWSSSRTIVAGISLFGEVVWHPGLCEFHSCELLLRSVTPWTFHKYSNSAARTLRSQFQSLPSVRDHRWGSKQRPIWKVKALRWKLVLWLQNKQQLFYKLSVHFWCWAA